MKKEAIVAQVGGIILVSTVGGGGRGPRESLVKMVGTLVKIRTAYAPNTPITHTN
jgi:hypothetical protein